MMTVAVTGASGFIGRHVVPLLLERGHHVRVLDRRSDPSRFAPGVETITGDVTDAAAVARFVFGAEIVFHLAAVAHAQLVSSGDRQRAQAVNVGGAQNVLQASRKAGVRRVVLASSAHVYKGQCGFGISEDAPKHAENLYAQTKIETESLALQAAADGMEVVIGRPCLTYGPNAAFNLAKLMRAIHRGYYFHIRSRKVTRSLCSAYTASRAFVHLAEKGITREAYNISDREPVDLADFVNDIAARMKRRTPVAVPYSLLWCGAVACSPLKLIGREAPVSFAALGKLAQSFALDSSKLAASGFEWHRSDERARQEMVDSYLAGAR